MSDCGIETLNDGSEICSLHKQPLQDITALDEVKNEQYTEMVTTFFCPVGKKHLTAPFPMPPFLSGDNGKALFSADQVATVKYRLWKRGDVLRGWVWHAKGHPNWHPIAPREEPFTLVLEDGRKLC